MHSACAQNWMKRLPTISHILSNKTSINFKISIEQNVKKTKENSLRFNAFEKLLIFVTLHIHIETHGSRFGKKKKQKWNFRIHKNSKSHQRTNIGKYQPMLAW